MTWTTGIHVHLCQGENPAGRCLLVDDDVWQKKDLAHRPLRLALFATLSLICGLVFSLEIPSG
jgi:hypothetical protein